MPTPLLDRIEARRTGRRFVPRPIPITERMSEFSKRLAEKRLPVGDRTSYTLGAFVPADSERGA